jgi:hypothetical protein
MKIYNSLSALKKHIKSQHIRMNNQQNNNHNGDQSLMICNKCINKKFTSKKALHLHQIRIHNICIHDKNDRYFRLISISMDKNIIKKNKHYSCLNRLVFSFIFIAP